MLNDAGTQLIGFTLGAHVAADNLNSSDTYQTVANTDDNLVYAVWKINTYTVTVKKVVDGDAEGESFSFTAVTTSEDYTLPEDGGSFSLANGDEKQYLEVPYGTVLTFTETPAFGYSIKNVEAKQTSLPDKTALE